MSAGLDPDPQMRALLQRFHFDAIPFAALRQRLAEGESIADFNTLRHTVQPLGSNHCHDMEALSSDLSAPLIELGDQALSRGELAVVILAGGMATRFNGAVKALVPVLQGQSFLDLKVQSVQQQAKALNTVIPIFVMTSFATHDEVSKACVHLQSELCPITPFAQFISLRVSPHGDLFRDAHGRLSPHAPGHGDLGPALKQAGLLTWFEQQGGRFLHISNVDNLGATPSPLLLGQHLQAKTRISAEVVSKMPGDQGGAPLNVNDKVQIVEAFRLPNDFDATQIEVFNTNSFIFDLAVFAQAIELDWFAVRKEVQDHAVIQFERLVGQLTAHTPTQYLHVSRSGDQSRFLPVKDPDELRQRLPEIRARLQALGLQ